MRVSTLVLVACGLGAPSFATAGSRADRERLDADCDRLGERIARFHREAAESDSGDPLKPADDLTAIRAVVDVAAADLTAFVGDDAVSPIAHDYSAYLRDLGAQLAEMFPYVERLTDATTAVKASEAAVAACSEDAACTEKAMEDLKVASVAFGIVLAEGAQLAKDERAIEADARLSASVAAVERRLRKVCGRSTVSWTP